MASTAWSGSFLFLVLAAIAAIGLLGVLLFVLGWRGRQINDHPVCGTCRFDLSGVVLAGTITTSTPRCPECGTMLDTPGSAQTSSSPKRRCWTSVGPKGSLRNDVTKLRVPADLHRDVPGRHTSTK